ncbi:glycosyltransferase [Albibacterium profundi]|uniref:Glycosyltransferase n=1 Tax=Albibacterium profundi TaxID=3134906 RepID=A0ABV5CBG2_9SPHI
MGLKDHIIFILGITKFDADIESTSFTTAKYLARENDVYYIDYPYTLKDYVKEKKTDQYRKRQSSFFSLTHSLMGTDIERLKILVLPPVFPINFLKENRLYRLLLFINQDIIINRIKAVIKKQKISNYIFINSFNFHYPDIGSRLKPKLSVYHCVDPIVIDYDKRHGVKSEAIILKSSDLVVCTSKQLYIEKTSTNPNTYFIPNAADIEHCSRTLDVNLPVFSKIVDIPKPIVGYFGNIERRIDFSLLHKTAVRNSDISFVFAGPVNWNYVPVEFWKLDNVHFIGKVAYKELPSVLKGFEVATIPFKKDEVSSTIFPLKLFEYLGAGKPVVSTDFNEDLKDYTDDSVIYCQDAEGFHEGIHYALTLNGKGDINKRLQTAANNTWEKRLAEFSALIAQYYELKNSKEKIALHRTS